jgi:hypothetical protein
VYCTTHGESVNSKFFSVSVLSSIPHLSAVYQACLYVEIGVFWVVTILNFTGTFRRFGGTRSVI